METALLGVPQLVCYHLSPVSRLAARVLVRLRHFSLPNILLREGAVPEMLEPTAGRVEEEVLRMLGEPGVREAARDCGRRLRGMVGHFQGLQYCFGSSGQLPSGEPGSSRPRCCASWQGIAIVLPIHGSHPFGAYAKKHSRCFCPCEARLGNCSMHCSTTYIHVGVAANRFAAR